EDMIFGTINVDYAELEDNVLIKSDGMPTYNFANVVDDHLMKISHVMRGMEYLSSTPKYNLIYDTFGWERPRYIHLPPIMRDATHKLSKRFGDANFDDFIKKGFLSEAIVNYIALLGWCPKDNSEKMTLDELIQKFDTDGISRSGSIFDEVKMRWLNSQYVKEMSVDEYMSHARQYFDLSVAKNKYDYEKLTKILISRTEIFSDIPEKIAFLDEFAEYDLTLFENKKAKIDVNVAKTCIELALPVLQNVNVWTNENLYETLSTLAEANGLKKTQIFWAIRVAITARESTPGGATELADILGKEECLKRLKFSLNLFK
ncbi:MAG: glutamate--tRNA ligase family protein, partial [Clostridia bacterium]